MDYAAVHTFFKQMRKDVRAANCRGVGQVFGEGAMIALRSYEHSLMDGSPHIECSERPTGDQITDFSNTMKEAGVTSFLITGYQSGSVSFLSGLVKEGWLWTARLEYIHSDGTEAVGAQVSLCTTHKTEK